MNLQYNVLCDFRKRWIPLRLRALLRNYKWMDGISGMCGDIVPCQKLPGALLVQKFIFYFHIPSLLITILSVMLVPEARDDQQTTEFTFLVVVTFKVLSVRLWVGLSSSIGGVRNIIIPYACNFLLILNSNLIQRTLAILISEKLKSVSGFRIIYMVHVKIVFICVVKGSYNNALGFIKLLVCLSCLFYFEELMIRSPFPPFLKLSLIHI